MRALIQRVSQASAVVDGLITGQIGVGLVVFVGVGEGDENPDAEYIVNKTVNLRIFPDEQGRLNRSALDIHSDLLVISQFTLYAETRRGRRPSFSESASPEIALPLFHFTLDMFRETGLTTRTGEFQAHMSVSLNNDGPVTIMIDSDDRKSSRRGASTHR